MQRGEKCLNIGAREGHVVSHERERREPHRDLEVGLQIEGSLQLASDSLGGLHEDDGQSSPGSQGRARCPVRAQLAPVVEDSGA